MDQPTSPAKPRILVAPLDWGLGHATRCVPLISALTRLGCNVLLAGEDKTARLLSEEFPHLPLLPLEGYRIRYARTGWELAFTITAQIPRIISAIEKEKEWLDRIVEEHSIDAVISDNRYGLFHEKIPTVFITHQLLIKTGMGKWGDEFLQGLNYQYIQQFGACWVPDHEGGDNLAGDLSHPTENPTIPLRYIGPLSRFEPEEKKEEKHLLVMLSGPEPQRTIFEDLLLEQLQSYNGPVVFVRGLPGGQEQPDHPSHILMHNHLPAAALKQVMEEASLVIARCGYSTVMDLAALRKKSILVPTPGQTEQSYLSEHLMKKGFALCATQDKFRLANLLELSGQFNYQLAGGFSSRRNLEEALEELIEKLRVVSCEPREDDRKAATDEKG
jgi:hypothetical protein